MSTARYLADKRKVFKPGAKDLSASGQAARNTHTHLTALHAACAYNTTSAKQDPKEQEKIHTDNEKQICKREMHKPMP